MKFTLEDLKRQFDSGTFSRGEAYARSGKVCSIRQEGDTMRGEVCGSEPDNYLQSIQWTATRHGIKVDGYCGCPVSHNCKHVVAVLLASLKQGDAAPAGLDVPAGAERWLRLLAETQPAASAPGSAAKSAAASRWLFVLAPDRNDGQPRLHVCRETANKQGGGVRITVHNDFHVFLVGARADLPADVDEAIRMMAALRAGNLPGEGVPPTGRIGARLLRQACAQGRLMRAGSTGAMRLGQFSPVASGPARAVSLAWMEDAANPALLTLCWRFDDTGTRVDWVVPTEPIAYIHADPPHADPPHADLLGEMLLPAVLSTLPPARLQAMVATAPSLQAHERAGIAARLVEQGPARLLPLPPVPHMRERRDIAPTACLVLDSVALPGRRNAQWCDYARLSFDYDGASTEGVTAPVLYHVAGDVVERIERDLQAERGAAAQLAGLGFAATDRFMDNALGLPGEDAWLAFARHELPRLRAAGWRIALGEHYRYNVVEADDWYAEVDEVDEGSGIAWFDLELGIVVNGERHALLPLLVELIRNAPQDFDAVALAARDEHSEIMVELRDATHVVLPWTRIKPILATLGELYFSDRVGDAMRLPVTDAARLAELDRVTRLRWMGGAQLRELGSKLHAFEGIRPVAPPPGLQAQLRAYQQAGVAWMQFLREYGFGGILADDMGLGKTIQALAHILVEKEAGRLDAPALVVAPTSLMANWQAEAARFAPSLRVLLLHGKDRKDAFARIASADLVLTTYPLLGRDEAALRGQRFHLLILDEAQYIKNSKSKVAQSARLIAARHRLCLTGTPIQNHLGELWSQFHFLMPGLLGEEKSFNAQFRKPIEQQGDSLRRDLLSRRIKPFMLRRTKDKVATELPPKTEIMLPVELGSAQRDLYETVRVAMDRKVRDEIDRKGLARSRIVILDALLKLRQVCCDPRLLKSGGAGSGEGGAEGGSAKLDALMELLDTLLSEGRKVLVFSQFTSMLALIEEALRARAVAYALLTGATEDRAAPVAAFQQGQVGVFLISLKAGGVGLNLTAADTVIHYDPWWNPASEHQATDRAWRIGQEQPVFVYKLIARGTLEEKIQEMQRRKGDLANALLTADAELATGIGADDLQAIFGGLVG